jgi:hypothetical protein
VQTWTGLSLPGYSGGEPLGSTLARNSLSNSATVYVVLKVANYRYYQHS